MDTNQTTSSRRDKKNLLGYVKSFLQDGAGSLRFHSHPRQADTLRFETVADGNRNMRRDLANVYIDLHNSYTSYNRHGKK